MVLCPSKVSEFWGSQSAHPEFGRSQLEETSLKDKVLFNILLFCANTRATNSLHRLLHRIRGKNLASQRPLEVAAIRCCALSPSNRIATCRCSLPIN